MLLLFYKAITLFLKHFLTEVRLQICNKFKFVILYTLHDLFQEKYFHLILGL
jgi:hypothetical protein